METNTKEVINTFEYTPQGLVAAKICAVDYNFTTSPAAVFALEDGNYTVVWIPPKILGGKHEYV